jgi:hypothetical protein
MGTQFEEEERDFKSFCHLKFGEVHAFEHNRNDFPDFTLHLKTGDVGVEHTRTFLDEAAQGGSQSKARASHQRGFCTAVEKNLNLTALPPTEVQIQFSGDAITATHSEQLMRILTPRLSAERSGQLSREDDVNIGLP